MALVPLGNGAGFFVSVTLIDKQEDDTVKQYELQAADYAAAVLTRANIIAALEGTSSLEIVSVRLTEVLVEDAIVIPAVGSVSDKLTVTFRLTDSPEKVPHTIPAPLDAIMTAPSGAGNNQLNFSNANYLIYEGLFLPGGDCFVSDGETIDATVKAVRSR